MADISYEDVLRLAEQLTLEEQKTLLDQLQQRVQDKKRSKEERKARLEAVMIKAPVLHEPSPRREDWYDDDGR